MNCFATAKFVPGLTNARSSIILVQTIKKGAQMNAEKEKVLSRRVKKKKNEERNERPGSNEDRRGRSQR